MTTTEKNWRMNGDVWRIVFGHLQSPLYMRLVNQFFDDLMTRRSIRSCFDVPFGKLLPFLGKCPEMSGIYLDRALESEELRGIASRPNTRITHLSFQLSKCEVGCRHADCKKSIETLIRTGSSCTAAQLRMLSHGLPNLKHLLVNNFEKFANVPGILNAICGMIGLTHLKMPISVSAPQFIGLVTKNPMLQNLICVHLERAMTNGEAVALLLAGPNLEHVDDWMGNSIFKWNLELLKACSPLKPKLSELVIDSLTGEMQQHISEFYNLHSLLCNLANGERLQYALPHLTEFCSKFCSLEQLASVAAGRQLKSIKIDSLFGYALDWAHELTAALGSSASSIESIELNSVELSLSNLMVLKRTCHRLNSLQGLKPLRAHTNDAPDLVQLMAGGIMLIAQLSSDSSESWFEVPLDSRLSLFHTDGKILAKQVLTNLQDVSLSWSISSRLDTAQKLISFDFRYGICVLDIVRDFVELAPHQHYNRPCVDGAKYITIGKREIAWLPKFVLPGVRGVGAFAFPLHGSLGLIVPTLRGALKWLHYCGYNGESVLVSFPFAQIAFQAWNYRYGGFKRNFIHAWHCNNLMALVEGTPPAADWTDLDSRTIERLATIKDFNQYGDSISRLDKTVRVYSIVWWTTDEEDRGVISCKGSPLKVSLRNVSRGLIEAKVWLDREYLPLAQTELPEAELANWIIRGTDEAWSNTDNVLTLSSSSDNMFN